MAEVSNMMGLFGSAGAELAGTSVPAIDREELFCAKRTLENGREHATNNMEAVRIRCITLLGDCRTGAGGKERRTALPELNCGSTKRADLLES
jgi:hypothetical protein